MNGLEACSAALDSNLNATQNGRLPNRGENLADLERIIERGLQSFIEVGTALMAIRDGRLYRASGFKTFEAYCQERWRWSRSYAYRQIQAAEVVAVLSPIGYNLPTSEGQARELVGLSTPELKDVAERVTFSKTTAAEVAETVKKIRNPALYSSESSEWYTPREVIDCVVKAIDCIDLDPCSNPGTPNVPAVRHFTAADDGLTKPWHGRVYMNPPYGREIEPWVTKLLSEYAAGRCQQAIALVPARVDTAWFRQFRDAAVCFIDGRLKFSGHCNSAPFPSAAVYLGAAGERFDEAFITLGGIWVRRERAQRKGAVAK